MIKLLTLAILAMTSAMPGAWAEDAPAGAAVAADGRAGMAMLATQMATATAALAWMFAEWITKGKPSVLGIASGAVAGLVAITPASGFVGPTPAAPASLEQDDRDTMWPRTCRPPADRKTMVDSAQRLRHEP